MDAQEERRYGWKPSTPDVHDRRLKFSPFRLATLPSKVNLKPKMPPVRHQGPGASCTAMAVCGLIGYRELSGADHRVVDPSPQFQYFNTRIFEKTTESDSGASLRNAILALQEYGFCDELCCPYDPERFADRPLSICYKAAEVYRSVSAHRVEQTLVDLRASLASGNPVLFGFTVYSAFENAATAATGIVNLPGPGEVALGGHAVMLIGYDDEEGRFLVRNSYGGNWGNAGHFSMPFDYVTNQNLSGDFWTFNAFR